MNLAPNDPVRDDYVALTAADAVRVERLLPGPIERVWDYLTRPELRATWFAAGEYEPRVGGRFDLVFRHASLSREDDAPPAKYAHLQPEARMASRITDHDPPRRLGYTFGEANGEESQVLFELSTQGDRVHLVVTHTRLTSREELLSVAAGWHTHLDILRDRLAGREPDGFWRRHTALENEYDARLPA